MIQSNQTHAEQCMSNKGTARLLADIAAATPDVRAELRAIAAEIKEFAPEYSVSPSLSIHAFARHTIAEAGAMEPQYAVWMLGNGAHHETVKAATAVEAVEAAKEAIRKARRLAETEARYARERAEIEAADSATKHEQKVSARYVPHDLGHIKSNLTTGPSNDATAEMLTVSPPILHSMSDIAICSACKRPVGEHIRVSATGTYRCPTVAESTLPLTSIGPSGIGGEYQAEVRP